MFYRKNLDSLDSSVYFSCETQSITAITDGAKGLNHHTQTDVILLDFRKAFDSVSHRRLLSQLRLLWY